MKSWQHAQNHNVCVCVCMCLYVYGCVKSNENTSGIVLCYKQADALRTREHETMTMAFVLVNLNIAFVSSARLENTIAIAIVPST